MSGHSKWSQIKHKKALTDAKKGKIFSKLARLITVAARQKGGDLSTNSQLRLAVEKARSFNMPSENIERAIKKGTGEAEGEKMEEMLIEAYGPSGVALMIEAVTDNKNRTVSEIKFLLNQRGGKMAEAGSVAWLFDRRGALTISLVNSKISKDDLELLAIDSGAQDLKWLDGDTLEIYTIPEDLEKIKKALEAKNIRPESAGLIWLAKTLIPLNNEKDKNSLEALLNELDEHPDVQEIYSNIKE